MRDMLIPKEDSDPARIRAFHRLGYELWMATANETQKANLVKVFKDKYHTFGEANDAIEAGEYSWLYVNPMTGELSSQLK